MTFIWVLIGWLAVGSAIAWIIGHASDLGSVPEYTIPNNLGADATAMHQTLPTHSVHSHANFSLANERAP